jgi:heptosyltransferase-2
VSAAESFLVVGPSWVGDMVMAQALYRTLRERAPNATIDVVAPPWSLPVLSRMPEVRRGIELAVGHGEVGLGRRYALGKRLRGEGYTRAIVLPRSAKAALVPWFARVPRRTGFRGEWRYGLLNDVRDLDKARLDQTVKRFVALGRDRDEPPPGELPAPLRPRLAVDAANLARLRAALGLFAGVPLLALMPGAEYGPAKRWPTSAYGAVAARFAGRGADVIVLGSAKERSLGDEIVAAASDARVRNLCGETSLADVIDLLAAADAAVSNDSGLMHVAAAAGTRVVAIYGSSTPAFTPPLTATATIVYDKIECSPCFERTCPLGHLRCLKEIAPERVEAAVEKLMHERRAAAPIGDVARD